MTQTNITVSKEDEPDDFQALTPPVVDEAKQDAPVETPVETPQANLDSEQVDYKNKFSESAKEAIRLTKENESLASKATLADKMSEVVQDQERIHEIARHTPEIADAICKRFGWGETYAQATQAEDEVETTIDPVTVANQVYDQRKADEERKAVENYEVDFFIQNKIAIGSPKYKAIMGTYSKYQPKNLQDSQEMFQFAYSKHLPNQEVELPSPNGEIGGSGTPKVNEFSDDDRQIMKEKGWNEDTMRKFKQSSLY